MEYTEISGPLNTRTKRNKTGPLIVFRVFSVFRGRPYRFWLLSVYSVCSEGKISHSRASFAARRETAA